MCYEIIADKNREAEAERFAAAHPLGSFMQSPRWAQVKPAWGHRVVVSRDGTGRIRGSMLVLTLADRGDGSALLYAPRGPVWDPQDAAAAADLVAGARRLAQDFGHGEFKCDPLFETGNTGEATLTALGLAHDAAAGFGDTVQPRENAVRRGLCGMSEAALFASFSQKTRERIGAAAQYGVECTACGTDALAEFYPVYAAMGQRKGFTVRPQRYLQDLLEAFGEDARLYLCRQDGEVLAGAIAVAFGPRVSYVYGGSDRARPELCVGYRLQWEMLRFALERGCDIYDLGGICTDPAENAAMHDLYRFKRNFSRAEKTAGEFGFVF